jgi:hypothetical protein
MCGNKKKICIDAMIEKLMKSWQHTGIQIVKNNILNSKIHTCKIFVVLVSILYDTFHGTQHC